MGKKLLLGGLILSGLLLSGCDLIHFEDLTGRKKAAMSILDQWNGRVNAPPLPPEIAAYFTYQTNIALDVPSFKQIETNSDYVRFTGKFIAKDNAHIRTFPSLLSDAQGNYTIGFDLYISRIAGELPAPLLVQLPALGSTGGVEKIVASYFARRGAHSVVVFPDHNATATDQPVDQVFNYFVRNTVSVQQVLDYFLAASRSEFRDAVASFATNVPKINESQIYGIGISLGGIRLSFLAPVEKRIRKSVIIMGGSNVANTTAFSDAQGAIEFQNHFMNELYLQGKIPAKNRSEFEKYLKTLFKFDSGDLAQYIDTKKVSMVITTYDSVVPTGNQWALYMALMRPQTATIEYRYYSNELLFSEPSQSHSGGWQAKVRKYIQSQDFPTGHFDIVFMQDEILDFAARQFILSNLP